MMTTLEGRRKLRVAAVAVVTPALVLVSAGTATGDQQNFLNLINQERAQNGCGPLAMNEQLNTAAQGYAEEIADTGVFSHNGPDGSTMVSRIRDSGYAGGRGLAENIAKNSSEAATVDGWMNSPGHRTNMLNCSYIDAGLGISGSYYVADFG